MKRRLDKTVMIVPLLLITALAMLVVLFPSNMTNCIDIVRNFLGNTCGVYYLAFGLGFFILLLYLAFSKIGSIKLGTDNDKPMNTFTWGILIFTSTMAADILFYSFHEWTYYYNSQVLLDTVVSENQKFLWSSTYSLFHWGFIPWSFYLVLAVIYAYMFYQTKRETARMSDACEPVLNNRVSKISKKIINVIAVFGLLCGTSTTFSVATPLMSSIVCKLTGIQQTKFISILILLLIASIYTFAVLKKNGISMIAKITTILFSLLLSIFFIFGNPKFILETGFQGLGNMLQNFFRMSTWTDPTRSTNFPQDWTIFYWSYWIAWCVATPFFIAKISKGRTIKQTIVGGLTAGLLGTFTSFITFGGFGMNALATDKINIAQLIEDGISPANAIVELISASNLSTIMLILLFVTMVGLYASTFDALTDVVSRFSYRRLSIYEEPAKRVKVFWAIVFIVFPIALLFSESATTQLMSISIIGAFPLTLIMMLVIISFFKDLKRNRQM